MNVETFGEEAGKAKAAKQLGVPLRKDSHKFANKKVLKTNGAREWTQMELRSGN